MALQIIDAKVQTMWLTRKEKVMLTRGPDKGKTVERKRRFKVTIGICIEFDDGWRIVGPHGRVHTGRGTVVRFNHRHSTWSVQRPQRCETNRVGYVFTPRGDPCWLEAERESGFSSRDFERSFSPRFVKLCKAGHDLAETGAAGPADATGPNRGGDERGSESCLVLSRLGPVGNEEARGADLRAG